jgi:hypothetical protein
MEEKKIALNSSDALTKALSNILGHTAITAPLSQVLAYAIAKGSVTYQEIQEIIEDDPEDVLLVADEWRLLVPVGTAKSSSWEDRLLVLRDGEIYEIPNIIRYVVRYGLNTEILDPEGEITHLFKELGDPDYKQIPSLVRTVVEEAINHSITGTQIKMICLRFGLASRVDSLIA